MKSRITVAVVIALAVLLVFPSAVFASVDQPDSAPVLDGANGISVFRNLRESGDMLFVVYAEIPYGTPPATPVTQAYTWSLNDGATELGSTTGFVYNDNGYNWNVYSMYFDSGNVTAKGMVWGTLYTMKLTQNPSQFVSPTYYSFALNAGDYTAYTAQDDNQQALADLIFVLADSLYTNWGLTATTTLTTELDAGRALSISGEAFFRGAIYGVQSMAPSIFSTAIRDISIVDRTWNTEFSANLTGQWGGTWVDTAQAAGKALFATDYDLMSIIMVVGLAIAALVANIMVTGDHWNGMIDVAFVSIVLARLGMYDLAILMLIAAMCWFYIGTKVWFGMIRAG